MDIRATSQFIKHTAQTLGFFYCGIAKAVALDEDARRLEKWLSNGYHANMAYMERNFDKRIDPRKLVDGAQSVITLLLNYYPAQEQASDVPKIAKYAYGNDYHDVIREKLNALLLAVQSKVGQIAGRGFVDSAPVLERTWAQKTGAGWVGKNGNLISKQHGSFFFIATLIIDIPLAYDDPFAKDFCGTCTKCIDHCPTDAIVSPTVIDANKCISYLTIELKDELMDPKFAGKMDNWLFGCDVCQDVCPWNRFSKAHQEPMLAANEMMLSFTKQDWKEMQVTTFNQLLKHSPIKRTKHKGILRNLKMIE